VDNLTAIGLVLLRFELPLQADCRANTGQTFTIQYDIFTVGAGYLDLDAALASQDTIPLAEVLGLLITLAEPWIAGIEVQPSAAKNWSSAGCSSEEAGRIAISA
jgi:hypothetical protein